MTVAEPDKPLRRDAERNRQRVLDAARELFAEEGLGITLNDIAHHAGVGVGTVYRRFPDKAQLIEELFEQRLEDLVAIAGGALDDPDAWHGLKTFLRRALELQANDRGVKDLITASTDGLDRVATIRARLLADRARTGAPRPGGRPDPRRRRGDGPLDDPAHAEHAHRRLA